MELKEVSLFRDVPEDGLRTIEGLFEQRRYRPGEVIYREGERGGALYVIKKGGVRVYRTGKSMAEVELARLKEGDIFGEMSFLDESPHTATIAALEETEVLMLPKSRFEELVDHNPRIAYLIIRNMLLVIESIIRSMDAEYVSLMDYMYVYGK